VSFFVFMGEICIIRFSNYETDERGSLGLGRCRREAEEGAAQALPRSKKPRKKGESPPQAFLGTAKWDMFAQTCGKGFQVPPPQPKNPTRESWIFSFVPLGTTSFAWYTQYHFEGNDNIISAKPAHHFTIQYVFAILCSESRCK